MKFTLRTQQCELRTPGEPTETGDFFREVIVTEIDFKYSRDPKAHLFRKIGTALAQAVEATTVPKELWFVELDRDLQREFNLPPIVPFG